VSRLSRRRCIETLAGSGVLAAGLVFVQGCGLVRATPQPPRVPRIGYLSTSAGIANGYVSVFKDGLRDLGYEDGRTIEIVWRILGDDPATRFAILADELVALNVVVIVTSSTPAVVAAARATRAIPIVSGGPSRDLTDLGLVERDARPGGNVTGIGGNIEVYGKLVELLEESFPAIARVGYLRDPTTPGGEPQMARSRAAAAQLGLEFLELQVRSREDVDAAFETAASAHVDGLIVSADTVFGTAAGGASPSVRLPLQHHLPTIYSQVAGYVENGGLMAYSPDFVAAQRRAAAYVDKILRGANPAELPVEQAMTFEFGVNLRTARALGVTIPGEVLMQATQVIR
jgi:putative tryptophan/tyrosine transport system substrate-binding protein